MYEINKVYIWQNQVGKYAVLNGTETTVIDGPFAPNQEFINKKDPWWETNSLPPGETDLNEHYMIAHPGDLRLKEPPSGQVKILEMFKHQPELVNV